MCRPFASDQSVISRRSLFIDFAACCASGIVNDLRTRTSSAYIYSLETVFRDNRSATNMLKSNGPRIEP